MRLVAGTASAVHVQPSVRGAMVLIAPPRRRPTLQELARTTAGGATAWITHDAGMTWPDRAGVRLVEEVLDRGGLAALVFKSLGDAMAAQGRLRALLDKAGPAPAGSV